MQKSPTTHSRSRLSTRRLMASSSSSSWRRIVSSLTRQRPRGSSAARCRSAGLRCGRSPYLMMLPRLLPLLLVLLPLPLLDGADDAKPPFVFTDVTKQAGLLEPLRGMMAHGAAWGDADNDGHIDLFVGTFADRPAKVYQEGGAKGPVPNVFLFNRKGRYEAAKDESMTKLGRVSGVALADLDNDGLLDLYVTNNGGKKDKGTPAGNLLYHNKGGGRFELVT